MEVWLTKGIFGKKIQCIVEDTHKIKTAMEKIYIWKNDLENKKKYKIEPYDRFIFNKDEVAIDFGDYDCFMLIAGENAGKVADELMNDGFC